MFKSQLCIATAHWTPCTSRWRKGYLAKYCECLQHLEDDQMSAIIHDTRSTTRRSSTCVWSVRQILKRHEYSAFVSILINNNNNFTNALSVTLGDINTSTWGSNDIAHIDIVKWLVIRTSLYNSQAPIRICGMVDDGVVMLTWNNWDERDYCQTPHLQPVSLHQFE